jgi:hypothetical protein
MKYVLGKHPVTGYYYPVVFPDEVDHVMVAGMLLMAFRAGPAAVRECVVGAGFLSGGGDSKLRVVPDQKSDSLGFGPGEIDEVVLRLFLEEGMAGGGLSNLIAYAGIKGIPLDDAVGQAVVALKARQEAGAVGGGKGTRSRPKPKKGK